MPVYDRARPGARAKVLWVSYSCTEEQRVRFGLARRLVREPSGCGDERAARAYLAQRKREVKDGSWRPRSEGGSGQTLATYAASWLAKREADGVRCYREENQRMRDYVLPVLGAKMLTEIRRADVVAMIAGLRARVSERTGRPLAARTVRHAYNDLRALYADAVADEVAPSSPCTLRDKRGELPAKVDADPAFRARAVFTRDEIERLMSDERIALQHRVLYALTFFCGLRIGEAVARRWEDYDPRSRPLGRLLVHSQHEGRGTKTLVTREVPVHPTLARLLATWKLEHYELLYARAPDPGEYIVPPRGRKGPFAAKVAWNYLQRDLETLGMRRRRVHDLRRTFVSLCLADGADKYLLKWVTHGRPKADAFDDYATPTWEALCKQVAPLQVELRTGKVARLREAK